MNENSSDPWNSNDHLAGGARVLDAMSLSLEEFWIASAGRNESGTKQVLVFGLNYLAIVEADGQVVLDVGHHEVRGVRQLDGSGIEIWGTSHEPDQPLRHNRWLHLIADADAKYLEDFWLKQFPITHSGIGLNPVHWKEAEYAYSVGRIITEATRCDFMIAELVVACRTLLIQPTQNIRGRSGTDLADLLGDLGKQSPVLHEISERYRAWYLCRNFVMHGLRERDGSGRVTDQVLKWRRGKNTKEFNVTFDVQKHDFERLALVWHAFYMLSYDAWRTATHVFTVCNSRSASPLKILRNLPTPNSVSESERLPPS